MVYQAKKRPAAAASAEQSNTEMPGQVDAPVAQKSESRGKDAAEHRQEREDNKQKKKGASQAQSSSQDEMIEKLKSELQRSKQEASLAQKKLQQAEKQAAEKMTKY